jgi:ABC-type transport system substrate-binding protein
MKNKNSGFRAKNAGLSIAVILTMVIAGFAVLSAPISIAQEDNLGGQYGGTLRVALKSQPSSLNPLAAKLNESAVHIIDVLYESLGRIDPYTLEVKPWMASAWTINPANTSIVSVKLKTGIKWHDGSTVTLNDVEYTFGPNGYGIDYISSMSKNTTSNTIVFNLTTPDSRFFSDLLVRKIVPTGFTPTTAPKGCGPFKLLSTGSSNTTVVAFDDHFNARPFIDKMVYTYYPFDKNYDQTLYPYHLNFVDDPRWDGFYRAGYDLITNKIDYIGWDLTTNQTTSNIALSGNLTTLMLNSNATLVLSSGLMQWYLGFNNAPGHILSDPALRKAISYAINKEALTVYDISGGLEKSDSIISKFNLPWFNSTIVPHGYDIKVAKQILDDAKYMDYDSDGYIEKPGPILPKSGYQNISLTLFGPKIEDVTPYTMSKNIITWFEILGIKVELVNNTMDVHMPNILADNFDMYLTNEESIRLDPQFMNNLYHSNAIATNTNLLNFDGKYTVDKYNLLELIKDNQTWKINLPHTNLNGNVLVTYYHNSSVCGNVSNASYTINMKTGAFGLNENYKIYDYGADYLNITYSYRPFDHLIEKSNIQMDPAERAKYIKEAQAVLDDLEPSIPLFSYKVNHAYRVNVYTGWVQTLGGINNYWSFTNIQNKIMGDSTVMLSSVKSYLSSGDEMNLFVKVEDLNGEPISESTLIFSGDGSFGMPEYDDVGQQYTVLYKAPSTAASKTTTIKVEAYSIGYTMATDSMDITIHPLVRNLNIEISRGATTLASGNTTSLSILVQNKADSTAISGANVVLTMTPTGLGGYIKELTGTTNSAGEFITTFGSDNVTIDTTFRITAYVTMDGYVDAVQTTSISVNRDPTIESTTDRGLLGLPAPSFLTIIVLLAGMSIVYSVHRRKRN